jgi:anti-sigma28 factor (negative regulator of flagellin synthesis)
MSNSIQPIGPGLAAGAYKARASRKQGAPHNLDRTQGPDKETVEISQSSFDRQKVMDRIRVLPDVRINKVEEIREQIKHNNYPIENRLYQALEKMVDGRILQ